MTNPSKDDALAMLVPEATVLIGGRQITLHEYKFVQGLRLNPLITPIVDAMSDLAGAGEIPDPEALRPVFSANADNIHKLIAESCGEDPEWVANLPDADGRILQLAWWTVNAHFFGRRVVEGVISRQMRRSIGRTYTSH